MKGQTDRRSACLLSPDRGLMEAGHSGTIVKTLSTGDQFFYHDGISVSPDGNRLLTTCICHCSTSLRTIRDLFTCMQKYSENNIFQTMLFYQSGLHIISCNSHSSNGLELYARLTSKTMGFSENKYRSFGFSSREKSLRHPPSVIMRRSDLIPVL